MILYTTKVKTPLWDLDILATEDSLVWLWSAWQKYHWSDLKKYNQIKPIKNDNLPIFNNVKKWLKDYFDWKNPKCNFKLDPQGTEFQKIIWEFLLEIPYWKTTTYWELAKRYAQLKGFEKMSAQAIWWAVWKNPISYIIPCHRVIWHNWKLVWYAWGLNKKAKLLSLEKSKK